jgi:hypothetical protein
MILAMTNNILRRKKNTVVCRDFFFPTMNSSPLRLVVRAQSGKERRRKEKKMATLVLWEVQSRLWRPIGTTTTKKRGGRSWGACRPCHEDHTKHRAHRTSPVGKRCCLLRQPGQKRWRQITHNSGQKLCPFGWLLLATWLWSLTTEMRLIYSYLKRLAHDALRIVRA